VDGRSYTATFAVKIDPRVKASPADLEEQFHLETRLSSNMTRSSMAVRQARSVHEQLQKLSGQTSGALNGSIKELDKKVSAILDGSENLPDGSSAKPSLNNVNGNINVLYKSVAGADAKPTRAQAEASVEAEHDLAVVMEQWDELKTTDLPTINRQLRDANLPEIHPERKPDQDESDTNVDEA